MYISRKTFVRFLFLLMFCCSSWCGKTLVAQYLFQNRVAWCEIGHFCLDCGDVKAGVNERTFKRMFDKMTYDWSLRGLQGYIDFQVNVDSLGKACVISCNDVTLHPITWKIIDKLHAYDDWKPAMTKGKIEPSTSIFVRVTIQDATISGEVQRVDIGAFEMMVGAPGEPVIQNINYEYENKHLDDYEITILNPQDSGYEYSFSPEICPDQKGGLWMAPRQGLVHYDGTKYSFPRQPIRPDGKYYSYNCLGMDSKQKLWLSTYYGSFSYDGQAWEQFDSATTRLTTILGIEHQSSQKEIFLFNRNGLISHNDVNWKLYNKKKYPTMPGDRVRTAFRDSKNRLWVGTYEGTFLINEKGAGVAFTDSSHMFFNRNIKSVQEDEEGNLYFSVSTVDRKSNDEHFYEDGIVILHHDGRYERLTPSNSGLPVYYPDQLYYDRIGRTLWITTPESGIVRYDLKGNWELYHHLNSKVPTNKITSIVGDQLGKIYVCTMQGIVIFSPKGK